MFKVSFLLFFVIWLIRIVSMSDCINVVGGRIKDMLHYNVCFSSVKDKDSLFIYLIIPCTEEEYGDLLLVVIINPKLLCHFAY